MLTLFMMPQCKNQFENNVINKFLKISEDPFSELIVFKRHSTIFMFHVARMAIMWDIVTVTNVGVV